MKSNALFLIPIVVSLPIAGAGCGDDGDTTDPGTTPGTDTGNGEGTGNGTDTGTNPDTDPGPRPDALEALVQQWCESYADCAPEEFAEYYGTVEECVSAELPLWQEDLDEAADYSEDCVQAFRDLADCELNAVACDESDCYAEYDAFDYCDDPYFVCDDGAEIPWDYVCDDEADCTGGDDEEYCE